MSVTSHPSGRSYLRYLLFRSGPLACTTLESSAFLGPRHFPPKLAAQLGAPYAAGEAEGTQSGGRPLMQLMVQPLLFPFASWGRRAVRVRVRV